MLRFVLAFCFISFCNSAPGIVGEYERLFLFQHSPISSFFAPEQRDVNTSDINFLQYVSDHWTIFDESKWIINRFWAIDDVGYHLTECSTYSGTRPYYKGFLQTNLKRELKKKWPTVRPNGSDEDLWKNEFITSGSCVTTSEKYYFNTAITRLHAFNIGVILKNYNILPNRSYKLHQIVHSISDALRARFHMKCLQPENSQVQYLLEFQLCFERSFDITDCYQYESQSDIYDCDSTKDIIYPGML